MAISVEARTEIISLVVGMFGAAPGASVLSDLVAAVEAGSSISQLAANLSTTAEFTGIYPTFMTNEEYAAKVVANLLAEASTEAKAEATSVLTTELNGGMTRATAMVEAIKFVAATESTNASFGTSAAAFDNKVAVAIYYSVDKALSGSTLAGLQSVVNGVTSDAATVTSAKATVDGTANVGESFKLTTTIDSFVGGAGNDTFDGTQTATPSATFTALDSIDGGLGNDTLKVVQTGALDTTTLGGISVKNVENIQLTSGAAVTTNSTAWTGATALTVTAATDATVTAAATTDVTVTAAALSVANTVNGGKDVTVVASDATALGTSSTASIAVGGTTAAAGNVKVTYTENVSVTADAAATVSAGIITTVTGGATVEVNNLATVGTGDHVGDIFTQGTVNVNGKSTSAVTVKQSAATSTWNGATVTGGKIVNGAVNITDTNAATAADTIKTVTLENFGLATITSSVLDTLNLKAGAVNASGNIDLIKSAADTSTAATTLTVNSSGGSIGILGIAGTSTQANAYTGININSSANTTFADLGAAANKTLTIAGEGVTTFTAFTAANNAALTSIVSTGGGASIGTELAPGVAFTGGAGVDSVLVGASTKAIDMGAGNDVVTVSTTTLGAGGSVKGGEGTDTLVANTNASAFVGLPGYTGFEVLRVAGAAAQGAHNAVGFTSLEVGAIAAAASFTNIAAGVGLTVLAAPTAGVTVTLADATGTADSFGLTLSSAATLAAGSVTIAGVETVNITNTDTSTSASQTNTLTLVAAAATSVVVTGNAGLTLTNGASTKITNFDASGITGTAANAANLAVTYTSANATVAELVTIKGGSGNDVLTGSATANDTILGGDGADTITYNGGADTFTGGAGADTFALTAVGTSTSYLTVADAVAADKVSFVAISTGTIADVTLGAKQALGGAATFTQYLDQAAAADGSTNALVKWFQFESNTYVVVDNAVGATFVSGTDAVVKLTGLVDLSTSALATEVLTLA